MTKKLREHIDEIIELRKSGMTIKELAEKYDVTYGVMASFLSNNRITDTPLIVAEDIKEKILNDYLSGKSYVDISKEVHMNSSFVRFILIDNGVEIKDMSHCYRKYTLDENYFDEIDTPNKAYILGMLYADGNVMCNKDRHAMRLALQHGDIDILEKINRELNSDRPIKIYGPYHSNKKSGPMATLTVHNQHMVESLVKWGVVPNKTDKVEFPSFLSEHLLRHFIRGLLDGDGYISSNPKEKDAGIVGRDKLLLGIRDYVEDKLGIHFSVSKANADLESIIHIRVRGGIQVKKFLDFIFNDADLYLDRKFNLYQSIYVTPNKSFVA